MPNLLELWQLGHIRSIANQKKEREIPWETVKPPQKTVKRPRKTVKRPKKTVKDPWILHLEYLKFLAGWSVMFDHSIAATLSPNNWSQGVNAWSKTVIYYISSNPIVHHPTRCLGMILLDRLVVCTCLVCKWHQMTLHEHDLHIFAWFVVSFYTSKDPDILGSFERPHFYRVFRPRPQKTGSLEV